MTGAYKANITNSRAAMKKRTNEVKTAQSAIVKFFQSHLDFIKFLAPEVNSRSGVIVKLNIQGKIQFCSNEQRALELMP